MKQITIAGRIGKDAVTRRTQNGDAVTGFTVAVDDGWGENKRTMWFDVSGWGARWERLAGFLTKGSPVTVTGELGTREHEGKTYLTLRANDVALQGGKRDDAPQRVQAGDPPRSVTTHRAPAAPDDDLSDLPF